MQHHERIELTKQGRRHIWSAVFKIGLIKIDLNIRIIDSRVFCGRNCCGFKIVPDKVGPFPQNVTFIQGAVQLDHFLPNLNSITLIIPGVGIIYHLMDRTRNKYLFHVFEKILLFFVIYTSKQSPCYRGKALKSASLHPEERKTDKNLENSCLRAQSGQNLLKSYKKEAQQ